jgi:hypothetical protein
MHNKTIENILDKYGIHGSDPIEKIASDEVISKAKNVQEKLAEAINEEDNIIEKIASGLSDEESAIVKFADYV